MRIECIMEGHFPRCASRRSNKSTLLILFGFYHETIGVSNGFSKSVLLLPPRWLSLDRHQSFIL